MEETQYLMTKWIYKPKVHHISCILKKALLAKVLTAWGQLGPETGIYQFLK